MDQREAKRLAWWLAASAVQASLDAGWPFAMRDSGRAEFEGMMLEDEDGRPTADGKRLADALDDVVDHMEERGRK
jgi:hypothetical protein